MTITTRLLIANSFEHARVEPPASPEDAPEVAPGPGHKATQTHFEDLIAGHQGRVLRVCRRLLRDKERAADVSQDVLLIAWARREHFDRQQSFRAWVNGIARNVCWRANSKKTELLASDGILEVAAAPRQLETVVRHQTMAVLQDGLRQLKPDVRRAITLRYFDDLDPRDINVVMGLCTRTGCRGLLYRGLKQLRALLSDSPISRQTPCSGQRIRSPTAAAGASPNAW